MANKKPGRGHFHIKKNTAGTSNEISFSVLDAKKMSMEGTGEKQGPRTVTELGKVSVFTMPGGGDVPDGSGVTTLNLEGAKVHAPQLPEGAAPSTSQHEIEARKKQRRYRRALNIVGIAAVVGLIALVGGTYLINMLEARNAGQSVVDEALELLMQTDSAILALDEAVAQPESLDAVQLQRHVSGLSAAASLADRASNRAQEALNTPDAGAVSEAAAQIREAAIARKALIVAGQRALELGLAAKGATDQATMAWDAARGADALARQAAALSDVPTVAEVEQATAASQQAADGFQSALVHLRGAQRSFPQADLSGFDEYLSMRFEAQHSALVSNASLSSQDRIAAGINSAAYNASEQKAAELLATLPASPVDAIVEAYALVGGDADDAYAQARERASRADAALRERIDAA